MSIERIREHLAQEGEEVVRLRKLSPYGEPMVLKIRYIEAPFTEFGEYACDVDPKDSFILLDIFAQGENGFHSIGFQDWEVSRGVAKQTVNQHQFVTPQTTLDELANEAWGNPFNLTAFSVDESYEKNNIGSFLTAIALTVLQAKQVEKLKGGYITSPGRKTWRRFGVEWKKPLTPVTPVWNHPFIEEILAEFL